MWYAGEPFLNAFKISKAVKSCNKCYECNVKEKAEANDT